MSLKDRLIRVTENPKQLQFAADEFDDQIVGATEPSPASGGLTATIYEEPCPPGWDGFVIGKVTEERKAAFWKMVANRDAAFIEFSNEFVIGFWLTSGDKVGGVVYDWLRFSTGMLELSVESPTVTPSKPGKKKVAVSEGAPQPLADQLRAINYGPGGPLFAILLRPLR